MVKIYTKTGDKGETSLYGGKRVLKSNPRVEAYGTIDELNSLIGVIVSQNQRSRPKDDRPMAEKLKIELLEIQKDLLRIGSLLANSVSERLNLKQGSTLMQKRVEHFEKLIDELSEDLPELKNFILPGGGEAGSLLHFARSVARKAERKVVALSQKEKIDGQIIIYFNRLSDLLFTMARFVNYKQNKKEIIWPR